MTRHTNGASFTEAHEKRETGLFQVRFEKVVHGLQVSVCGSIAGGNTLTYLPPGIEVYLQASSG